MYIGEKAQRTGGTKQTGDNISPGFRRLLLGRGISEEEMPAFLHPSLDGLASPYEVYGMERAVERIRRAVDKKEKILIFGDYDCDGICAISILMLALRGRADVSYFIPNSITDGYGMSVDLLKDIISHRKPDLVVSTLS